MINIPTNKLSEFERLFKTHKLNIAASNIFLSIIKALNKNYSMLDRKTYQNNFLGKLSDIELRTPPTDAFVPSSSNDDGHLLIVNQITPEFMEISKRITLAVLEDTLGKANDIVMKIKNDISLLETIQEDIYTYYCMFKYLDQIDIIRLSIYSNYTPIIEYIVDNISLEDWKDYMHSKKINEEKYIEKCSDILFNPDVAVVQKFYATENGDIKSIDVINFMMKLVSNIVLKTDIYLILGMFLILSFAMIDIKKDKIEESPCAKYVRDVISEI